MAAASIQRIPYSASRDLFIDALKKDGCVIVEGFTTVELLEQARQEVQPFLDADGQKTSKVGGTYCMHYIFMEIDKADIYQL